MSGNSSLTNLIGARSLTNLTNFDITSTGITQIDGYSDDPAFAKVTNEWRVCNGRNRNANRASGSATMAIADRISKGIRTVDIRSWGVGNYIA